MKRIVPALTVILALLCVLFLTGCGCRDSGASSGFSFGTDLSGYSYSAPMVAEESYGGFAAQADSMALSSGSVKTAAAGSISNNGSASGMSDSGSGSSTENADADIDPEKIIYSGNVTLETTDFDSSITALEALIEKCGGWVESSSVSGNNYSTLSRGGNSGRSADYTIRVPNEQFSGLMEQLSSLGNIPYSAVYTENVTAQYYDTQARLTTYQAQETRLLELLDKAETVPDIIEIENELTNVRYSIESLQTSLRNWDRRVNWSTVYLTVSEVFEYTPEQSPSYFTRMKYAAKNGIESLGDFLIDLVEILPVLLVVLALILIIILFFRAILRKRPRKKKNKEAASDAAPSEKAES